MCVATASPHSFCLSQGDSQGACPPPLARLIQAAGIKLGAIKSLADVDPRMATPFAPMPAAFGARAWLAARTAYLCALPQFAHI